MAGRKTVATRPVAQVQVPAVDDVATQRALDVLVGAVQSQQTGRQRVTITFDLVVGTNKVRHGLGRSCTGYNVTPTTADATFAHAIDKTNPSPQLEVWITVVGIAQPSATIEVF